MSSDILNADDGDSKRLPWQVGRVISTVRAQRGLSLRDLSQATKGKDPAGHGVLPAQISRIENGAVPDLRETHLLCDALGFDASKLLKPDLVPWYVVRRETALATLKEVQNGSRKTERLQKRHKHMMDMNIYHYVPLEEEYAREGEREGKIYPGMRSYLFEVARASEEDVSTGLDSHPGEEVVLVTEGELEFWYRQPSDGIDRSLLLRPGDCIHYSSELPHGYRAAGKTDAARALFVFADPRMSIPSDITTSATSDEE